MIFNLLFFKVIFHSKECHTYSVHTSNCVTALPAPGPEIILLLLNVLQSQLFREATSIQGKVGLFQAPGFVKALTTQSTD